MAAIPKYAPVLIIDGAIREVTKVTFEDRETHVVRDNGRKLIILTSQGFAEMKVGAEDNAVAFNEGESIVVYAELSEWSMESRTGMTFKFADFVTEDHLKSIGTRLRQTVGVHSKPAA